MFFPTTNSYYERMNRSDQKIYPANPSTMSTSINETEKKGEDENLNPILMKATNTENLPFTNLQERYSETHYELGKPLIPGIPEEDGGIDLETNKPMTEKHKSPETVAWYGKYYFFPQSPGITDETFLHVKYVSPLIRKFIVCSLLTILGILLYVGVDIYIHNFALLPSTIYMNTGDDIPTYRLTFIGDSLIHRPYVENDLGGRLQRHFQTINLNITDRSVEGNTIARVKKTVVQDIPPGSADMVLLFWDTDVSNYDEATMTPEEVATKRYNYLQDLAYVVNVTKHSGVKYIAISGPNLLGEGPCFNIFLPPYIVNKKTMLEEYVEINRNASIHLHTDYIDMRQAFLHELPSYWILSLYHLTYDGEHPNERGTGIIAGQFANQISNWTGAPVRNNY